MNDVTTKAPRLSEAQKRAVACPTCGVSAGKACRGSRTPGPNTFGGGWGGPPDLDRAHDTRRQAALRALPPTSTPKTPKIKPMTATVLKTGKIVPLAPRVEAGLVPCTGEAHSNAFIDNCMVCAPRWGEVMSYAPLMPAACREGFAVPFNAGDRKAFDAAEKLGEVMLVTVTTKSSSFSAWIAAGCVTHSDCATTPALGQACAEDTRPAAADDLDEEDHVDRARDLRGLIDPRCAPSLAGGLNPHGTTDNGHLPDCECEDRS